MAVELVRQLELQLQQPLSVSLEVLFCTTSHAARCPCLIGSIWVAEILE